MALNVQDDAGSVANANAYIDLDYFDSYFDDRNIDLSSYTDDQKKGSIVKATDHIDSKFESKFGGQRLLTTQTTALPRKYFYDIYNNDVSSQIPIGVKKATAEYALAALQSSTGNLLDNPVYDESGQNIKSKTDRVEGAVTETITYKDDYVFHLDKKYPKADLFVEKYLTAKAGGSYFLIRG